MMPLTTKKKKVLISVLSYAGYVLVACIFVLPMIYLFVSSFKTDMQIESDISSIKAFLPTMHPTFDNFVKVFVRDHFHKFFLNSTVVACIYVTVAIVFNSMMGYALGMLEFKGRRFLISLMIAMSIIPAESVIINRFMVVYRLHMLNSYWGLALPMGGFPMFVFLYYNHFKGMPKELMEAAIMDGDNYNGIFWKIMLPLSKPIIATVAIMAFIGSWGDLLWPTLVTRDEQFRTLPLALQALNSDIYIFWGQILTFSLLMTIPLLLVFLCFQKQFIQSLAMTGIKG